MEKEAGVIGLGIMGGAMSANLVQSGWRVHGYDPSPAAREAAAASGVTVHEDVAGVVAVAPVLMTSLPSPAALHATASAIAAAKTAPRVVVEVSTMALEDKLGFGEVLAAAGHTALDCPISGTGAQAKVRDLVIYASGDSATIARIAPFFEGFARATHDVGAYGNGSRMKYVANLLVAIHNVASAEAMVLGEKAGLDPKQIVELIGAGAGTSRVFELRAPMMASGEYEPATMKVSIWQKDMAIIGQFATALGVPTPLLSACIPVYASAMSLGHAAHDTAAVCDVLQRMAGLPR
ncbi:MAG: NAD(P)-dependent oxidoreductase [Acetobacteraceae bacterium]|nr:NAD(P)-dependent oxidoreductase [Acetobacteraceae bacterium]